MESSSSESDDLHELANAAVVEGVQARRVQLVNTRAKATAVSSPSMASLTRSPRPGATGLSATAPMVNVFPPTPDLDSSFHEERGMKGPDGAAPVMPAQATQSSPNSNEKRWSGRDSCLLALSLEDSFDDDDAYADGAILPEPTEKPARGTGHSNQPGSMDFGFPACPPTAPLNLAKLRQKKEQRQEIDGAQSSVPGSDSSASSLSQGSSRFDSDSMPSLTSASSVASSPASVRSSNASPQQRRSPSSLSPNSRNLAVDGMPQSLASSTSLASIATTGTSILDFGMSHEEARRYVHHAQLSHDAFGDDLDNGLGLGLGISKEEMSMGMDMPAFGAPARRHEDSTPKMSSAPFTSEQGPRPAINVVAPGDHVGHRYHYSQDDFEVAKESPRLNLDLDFGGSLGLSLSPDSRSPSPAGSLSSGFGGRRSSRVRTPSPSPTIRPGSGYGASERSITPTPANTQQERERAQAQAHYHATGLGLDLGGAEQYTQHHTTNIRQSVASVASWEMGVAL